MCTTFKTCHHHGGVFIIYLLDILGICQDGDECPFLHRTAGDTERRYHLRYFKTAPCVHETDARGFCVKNGVHCAFAHGNSDLRNPVYDIRDIRVGVHNCCFRAQHKVFIFSFISVQRYCRD